MIIRTSPKIGAVAYRLADVQPRLTEETGEQLIAITIENARTGAYAELMFRPDEIERLYVEKWNLRK